MLSSMVCRYEHFTTEWYVTWAKILPLHEFGLESGLPPRRPHRKAWEWCAISQALAERGMLEPGRTGCGFAVGAEPLPAAFAARGADVLATDQPLTAEAQSWVSTGQHAASREALYRPRLIDRETFDARVRFRNVNMRDLALPWDERFDFIWSSCSLEHLGSLAAGWTFVLESLELLKPGGVAVHTTEFNVASNDTTLADGDSVIYRQCDIEELDRRLRRIGCGLSRCDFFAGDHPHDLDVDVPPYDDETRSHVKLLLGGHVSTSALLIIRKGVVPLVSTLPARSELPVERACSNTGDSLPRFIAHNIRLDDGTQTHPSVGFTMDEHPITQCMRRVLSVLYPGGPQGKTIIDVGCLEGGFATEFARMGLTSTGIEVRTSNYNNCRFLHSRVNLPNLRFIQADASDIARFGRFDIFFVSGLLDHLDKPKQFLEAVARNCGKALVLWTHVTQAEENEASRTYALSELTENEGLQGRWYTEHGDIPDDEFNELKWTSRSNQKSFWIQKEYLLQTLKDLGFDLVFEQFDCMDDIVSDMTHGFYRKIDRVLLVAVKTGARTEHNAMTDEWPAQCPEPYASDAEARAQAAEERLAEARVMAEALRSSSSWRITAPLRRASMLLRGFGRSRA